MSTVLVQPTYHVERRKAWMYSADDLEAAKTHLRATLPEGGVLEVELAAMWSELD